MLILNIQILTRTHVFPKSALILLLILALYPSPVQQAFSFLPLLVGFDGICATVFHYQIPWIGLLSDLLLMNNNSMKPPKPKVIFLRDHGRIKRLAKLVSSDARVAPKFNVRDGGV